MLTFTRNLLLVSLCLVLINCDKNDEVPQNVNPDAQDCQGASFTNGLASVVSDSEIKVTSNLFSLGNEKIITHGHLIKKGQRPDINDYDAIVDIGTKNIASDFTSTFGNLDHSSTYYIVAFVGYSTDTCFHDETVEIATPFKPYAQVKTVGFEASPSNEIILSGLIENTFNEDVIRYGFTYTAGSNPPDMTNAILESGQNLSGTISSSNFSSSIEDASSQYIYTVSAFAENSAGISIADPIKTHRYDFDFTEFDLPNATYTTILSEPFDDNSNNWYEGEGSTGSEYDMKSGYYRMIGSSESAAQTTFKNPAEILEGLDNYQIDVVMDFNSGGTETYSGFRFEGEEETYYEYFFGITKDAFIIGHWTNQDLWETIEYATYDNISSSGENTLTLRKVYNQIYLFVNSDLLYSFEDFDFDGSRIRLRAARDTSVDFKDLKVRRIL